MNRALEDIMTEFNAGKPVDASGGWDAEEAHAEHTGIDLDDEASEHGYAQQDECYDDEEEAGYDDDGDYGGDADEEEPVGDECEDDVGSEGADADGGADSDIAVEVRAPTQEEELRAKIQELEQANADLALFRDTRVMSVKDRLDNASSIKRGGKLMSVRIRGERAAARATGAPLSAAAPRMPPPAKKKKKAVATRRVASAAVRKLFEEEAEYDENAEDSDDEPGGRARVSADEDEDELDVANAEDDAFINDGEIEYEDDDRSQSRDGYGDFDEEEELESGSRYAPDAAAAAAAGHEAARAAADSARDADALAEESLKRDCAHWRVIASSLVGDMWRSYVELAALDVLAPDFVRSHDPSTAVVAWAKKQLEQRAITIHLWTIITDAMRSLDEVVVGNPRPGCAVRDVAEAKSLRSALTTAGRYLVCVTPDLRAYAPPAADEKCVISGAAAGGDVKLIALDFCEPVKPEFDATARLVIDRRYHKLVESFQVLCVIDRHVRGVAANWFALYPPTPGVDEDGNTVDASARTEDVLMSHINKFIQSLDRLDEMVSKTVENARNECKSFLGVDVPLAGQLVSELKTKGRVAVMGAYDRPHAPADADA